MKSQVFTLSTDTKLLPEKSPLHPPLSERTGLDLFLCLHPIPLHVAIGSLFHLIIFIIIHGHYYSDDVSVDSLPPPVKTPEVPEPQRKTLSTNVLRGQSMPPATLYISPTSFVKIICQSFNK